MPTHLRPVASQPPSRPAPDIAAEVGQMLIVGFSGRQAEDPGVVALRRQAEAGEVGGAIFFGGNIESPHQLRALLAHMRSWRCPLPFLTLVDQEGGAVQRLHPNKGFAGWPAAGELGEDCLRVTRRSAAGMARELAECGFHVNLAPVVDLHDAQSPAIGGHRRSYGSEVSSVVERARAHIQEHRLHGLASAIKHFPGHGSAHGDTHRLGITDVTDCHRAEELAPFADLIASGAPEMVMTSHLVHRGLAPMGEPITFSPGAVRQMLRDRLGFGGVIISDDLCMGALVGRCGGLGEVIARAIGAGHDLVIVSCPSLEVAAPGPSAPDGEASLCSAAAAAVVAGITMGFVSGAEVAASHRRVAALKAQLGGGASEPPGAQLVPMAG